MLEIHLTKFIKYKILGLGDKNNYKCLLNQLYLTTLRCDTLWLIKNEGRY